jgi:hypothetical protein
MDKHGLETVEEILGGAAAPVATAPEPLDPARHPGMPPFPTPGIYFGMPEEEYFAIHAASASGLKRMSVSSMDYWAGSDLNLNRTESDDGRTDGKVSGKELGKAYHALIVEGQEAFDKRYAIALDREWVKATAEAKGKKLCVTVADIREAIDAAGAKPKGTAKDALIEQLLDLDEDAFVWDRMVATHNEVNAGKLMLSSELYERILIAKAMIIGDPQLKDAFTGGHPEVSIFWYDERTGVPMKARLDYIKMNHLVDLKSFGNRMNKPIQRAIDMAISNEKYFIPVVVYLEAIEAAKKLIRESKHIANVVFECGIACGPTAPSEELKKWCWAWAHQPEPEVVFIFQQTGIAPVTRGRIMPHNGTYLVTHGVVQALKRKWRKCAETYGTDPWLDFEPMVATADEDMTWAATDFGDIA